MNENSTMVGVLLVLMSAAFFSFGGTIRGCSIGSEYTNVARKTQQCQIAGREFHCQENSAWWNGNECSCSVSNTNRIRFNLPD